MRGAKWVIQNKTPNRIVAVGLFEYDFAWGVLEIFTSRLPAVWLSRVREDTAPNTTDFLLQDPVGLIPELGITFLITY